MNKIANVRSVAAPTDKESRIARTRVFTRCSMMISLEVG